MMPHPPYPAADLRRLQTDAEKMARLSPFTADRERFRRIADRYREEAESLERENKAHT